MLSNLVRSTLLVTAAALGVSLPTAAPALAAGGGKGGAGGGDTLTVSPAGPYSFGGQVSVTTDVPTSLYPGIQMACYQNGVLVGTSVHSAFPGGWYYGVPFLLGPSSTWTSGAADCTFTVSHLSNKRTVVDARGSIRVNG